MERTRVALSRLSDDHVLSAGLSAAQGTYAKWRVEQTVNTSSLRRMR